MDQQFSVAQPVCNMILKISDNISFLLWQKFLCILFIVWIKIYTVEPSV
jgi:hypothetical protein